MVEIRSRSCHRDEPLIAQRTIDAIEASDTDELLRIVDGHCEARDWDRLALIRHRCQEAVTRGKQLWGVDAHIRYRLVLEGPPVVAGPVLNEGRVRFGLGPLPEVAASTKTWSEMVPYLDHGPQRQTFAAERVVRGEEVDEPLELPFLQSWEPTYPVPVYKSDRIETPSPSLPAPELVDLPSSPATFEDPESEYSLADLVEPWVSQSNGRSQIVTVEGTSTHAIAALGTPSALIAQLELAEALAIMAWAASSGGAHGDRRGAAAGRYLTWWVVTTLGDLDWPADPDEVGKVAERMNWHWFDDHSPDTGWALRIAVDDPSSGLAWAIAAGDLAD